MKAFENENWNDEYQDDIESQGMPLIRQGQSNSPKVLEGVFGIGDFLMPNGVVATLIGVVGQPGGPSIEQSWVAKTLRHSFKQGRAWASEPLPAIAAPAPTEAPQISASERTTPKPDIRSALGASKSDAPPFPSNEYDGDAGGPHNLDEVIFD